MKGSAFGQHSTMRSAQPEASISSQPAGRDGSSQRQGVSSWRWDPGDSSTGQRIRRLLTFLYGGSMADQLWAEMRAMLVAFQARNPELSQTVIPGDQRLSERDAILITYGDQFREAGRSPLRTLHDFLNRHLRGVLSGVHILPFFPYSSDDGFSVIDYRQVNPELGTWDDIADLRRNYRLMFDAVINHISRQSAWFQGFLQGQAPYTNFFITMEPDTDLSQVVRPRALPLLTPVETARGRKYVWTTFSEDQIDLNYANPEVLLEVTDVLLFYVAQGAEIIRLDAIAYLWKEVGTPCIHLPQTHAVIKLWRAVLDAVAPNVLLITETNVPHQENISYFGEPLAETGSTDEAQMVYNFSLAPLTMHALQTGDASRLSQWAATLHSPAPGATFFNFIASHDGIGVLPARGILTDAEIQALVDQTLAHGGQVSHRANPDGSRSVYELNITLYDFLNDPQHPDERLDVQRFLASQAILLSLAGVPGIYVHSLFGSRNCYTCVAETGRARSINRQRFQREAVEAWLADPTTHQSRVFRAYCHLLRQRRAEPAFHPSGHQQVLQLHPALFALVRTAPRQESVILCLINVSRWPLRLTLDLARHQLPAARVWRDLISGQRHQCGGEGLPVELKPYQALWLKAEC